jgi:DNA-directed RNA polymerase specialized sigma24 family protein
MKRSYKVSENERHRRSERLKLLNADADFVAKQHPSPEATLNYKVAMAARLTPRAKRLAITRHLQTGMTPEEVCEEIRVKFGEVHVVVVRQIAEIVNRYNKKQTHSFLKCGSTGPM